MRMGRRWWWLLICLPVVAGLWRLRFDVDVLNLLPGELPAVHGLKLHQEHFANDRELLVTVEAPTAEDASHAAEAIATRLRAAPGLVERAVWQPPWLDHPEDTADFIAWLWLNQTPEAVQELADRLDPARLPARLEGIREQLATSFSPTDIARFSYDPLGLTAVPGEGAAGFSADPTAGEKLFANGDGTFRLIFVSPAAGLGGFHTASRWLRDVRMAVAGLADAADWPAGVKVGYTGKPAFLAEAAEGMARDMRTSVLATVAIIAVLFWLAHRRWGPLLWLVALLQVILLVTAALGGLVFGVLNLVSFGFAAILMGLSVDYALVLFQEAASGEHADARAVRLAAGRAIWGSALTTAVAFALLNLAGLPGLAQLGSLVAMGVVVAALVMAYAYLPLALRNLAAGRGGTGTAVAPANSNAAEHSPPRPTPGSSGVAFTARRWAPTLVLLMLAVAVLARSFPEVDHSTRPLTPRGSRAEAAARTISQRFGQPGDPLWILVAAPDVAGARERLVALHAAIASGRQAGLEISADLPLPLWPDGAEQAANLPRLAGLAGNAEELTRLAEDAGFTAEGTAMARGVFAAWQGLKSSDLPVWPWGESSRWLVERVAAQTPAGWLALGMLHPGPGEPPSFIRQPPAGVTLCGWQLLGEVLLEHVEARLGWLVAGMLVALFAGLRLTFGRWKEVGLSLAAVAFGLGLMLAVMRMLGWSWNLMNLTAVPLLLGSGIDYSIHVQLSLRRRAGAVAAMRATTGRALLLCGSTTMAAFGSLALSSNAGLASLGQVCAVGIACLLVTALYLLPAWSHPRSMAAETAAPA
ncbi:MAG: MMPL family transporter [Verrucomicrobiales bacterium]|nr:MMPL family transporter [Verrucomicrobiales bacterium]